MNYTVPPNSPEAERAVIGACLVSREALGTAIEILRPDDFYSTNCRDIYETLSAMYLADKPADIVTVSEELQARGIFGRLGGQPFLAELTGGIEH